MLDPLEMGNRSHEDIVVRLERLDVYRGLFKEAFGTESITIDRVAQAIATFERTLLSGNSPFDRYQRGDAGAVSASAQARASICFAERLSATPVTPASISPTNNSTP